MKYGRFTDMPREEVKWYLESRGFAVYDKEATDELREAAYLNAKDEIRDFFHHRFDDERTTAKVDEQREREGIADEHIDPREMLS
jgi:hypothetical protein